MAALTLQAEVQSDPTINRNIPFIKLALVDEDGNPIALGNLPTALQDIFDRLVVLEEQVFGPEGPPEDP
jgi:hypothetical protein